jgi:hypothetical protein
MSGVKDEHSVEEFSTEAVDPAFHDRVCAGRPDRSLDDLYTLAGEDRVEPAGELRVPVADQEFQFAPRSPRSMSRLRACWHTQSAVGCAVTPRTCTRRLACSTTAKQYSRVTSTVSQWKKSQARLGRAGTQSRLDRSVVGMDRFRCVSGSPRPWRRRPYGPCRRVLRRCGGSPSPGSRPPCAQSPCAAAVPWVGVRTAGACRSIVV